MATIRLGDILKDKGLIDDKRLQIALQQQKVSGELLGDVLIKLGFVSSVEMTQILAEQSGMPYEDVKRYPISDEALKLFPKDVAQKAEFLPLDIVDGTVVIGITNPSNIFAIDTVAKITKKPPKVYLIDPDGYKEMLNSVYFFLENPIKSQIDSIVEQSKNAETVAGNTIANLTNLIIMDGIRQNATDLHITPMADIVGVFFRIDGVIEFAHAIPKSAQTGLISRIKIMSQLDIAEQRLPQDGSFTFTFLDKIYNIRVSTVPTIYGENVVLRILAGSTSVARLSSLGYDEKDVNNIRMLFHKPYGIIIITGPTGSGKTTTLYSALKELDLIERNVITVEDPVEYKLTFTKQTQINEKAGYDFALASKSFMRQDPDVILLGEIRDSETARMAIRASITGHLVLSTLHTNDAVTVIPRLLDMDVDKFLLSSSLLAVMAQRLIRKICPDCKVAYELNAREKELFAEYGYNISEAYKGTGCKRCRYTGYSGRTVVGEVMIVDDELKELIYSSASVITIKEKAIEKGMRTFKADAIAKAVAGITTTAEIERVAG